MEIEGKGAKNNACIQYQGTIILRKQSTVVQTGSYFYTVGVINMIFGNDAFAKKARNARSLIIFNPLCFLK